MSTGPTTYSRTADKKQIKPSDFSSSSKPDDAPDGEDEAPPGPAPTDKNAPSSS